MPLGKLGVALAGASFFLGTFAIGCGATEEEPAPGQCAVKPAPLPPVVDRKEILRLDEVVLGEADATGAKSRHAWRTIGMNLDGLCSTSEDQASVACKRQDRAPRVVADDGEEGIDNAFGKELLRLLEPADPTPSVTARGTSYLALEGGGRATFYLGRTATELRAVIPLVNVRITEPDASGMSLLVGVAPAEALAKSIRDRAHALIGQALYCEDRTPESMEEAVLDAADIRTFDAPDPSALCDGISFAFHFKGSSVATAPTPPKTCAELEADADL